LIAIGREFHHFLFSRSENRQLVAYTERLSSKLHLLFYRHWASLYGAESIRRRHEDLLTVLRTGDLAAIEVAFRRHYAETGARVAALYPAQSNEDDIS